MTNVAAPFGFRPVYHPTGFDRGILRYIAPAYGTTMYKGQPVMLNTNGTIVTATPGADILGILAGVEFIDPTGKPNYQTFWPGGQLCAVGTQPRAYVWEDPATVFEVQSVGTIGLTAIGDQADAVNIGVGNAGQGASQCALGAPVGAGTQGQFRVYKIALYEDNAPGDLYPIVEVQIARHQMIANKVAI
jgi:hypothetical protein